MTTQATLMREVQDYEAAAETLRRALEIVWKAQPSTNPRIAAVMGDVAMAIHSAKDTMSRSARDAYVACKNV